MGCTDPLRPMMAASAAILGLKGSARPLAFCSAPPGAKPSLKGCSGNDTLSAAATPVRPSPGWPRFMPARRGRRAELQERARVPLWACDLLEGFRGHQLPVLRAVRQALRWLLAEVQGLIDSSAEAQTDLDLISNVYARAEP